MNVNRLIANRKNYGNKRNTSKIRFIVVHYTGNDGDSDENNAKYFAREIVNASAHYFVDDNSITQSVDDDYVAWSVGGAKYPNTNGGKFYRQCINTNSLSIELCDSVKNGKYDFTTNTLKLAVTLIQMKMKQYNIPIERVIRHYDVNGKVCPGPFVEDESAWNNFKAMIMGQVSDDIVSQQEQPDGKNYIDEDSKWGIATTIASQTIYGTETDGEISNQPAGNKKYLCACYSTSWKFKEDGYKKGSSLIKAIQRDLKAKGYYTGTIDGWCGKNTVKAIQNFLKDMEYYSGDIDGSMGPATVKAWQQYINSRL